MSDGNCKVEQPATGIKIDESAELNLDAAATKTVLEAALKREVEDKKRILELENQNKRLKNKRAVDENNRAADAAKIASLEAELIRMKNLLVKKEQASALPVKTDENLELHANEITLSVGNASEETELTSLRTPPVQNEEEKPVSESARQISPNKDRTYSEPIICLDSDDEDLGLPEVGPAPIDERTSSPAATRSATVVPDTAARSQRESPLNPQEAWSSFSSASTARSFSPVDLQVKEEFVDVIIKAEAEGETDQFMRVALIKSEDGRFDIWNVDGFGLGPKIEVAEKYLDRGFSRKVISHAFGGGHQTCNHHWNGKPGTTPFATFSRSWNNALPIRPGAHGMGFFGMHGCPVAPKPINFFVGEGRNDWRLVGTYDYLRWGEVASHHISLLPQGVIETWAHGALRSQWGKTWIEELNADLKDARKIRLDYEGVVEALHDGRLRLPFTILKCVGYPTDWFEKCEHFEANPKPPKTKKGKRRAPRRDPNDSPKKQAKTLQKGKRSIKREESVSDSEFADEFENGESEDDNAEYTSGSRPIASMPVRTSARKSGRAAPQNGV